MAVTFPDKQKWVASLEAAIKSLQRVEATFKRTVSYPIINSYLRKLFMDLF